MEKKTAAILVLAMLAAVAVTAGGAYAMDRQSYPTQSAASGSRMGPGMMGGQSGHPGGAMGGGFMQQMMHGYMQNYSHAYAQQMMNQYDYNYTHLYGHEYLWNYCNSTSTG